jgi:GTP cyclohydrolase II
MWRQEDGMNLESAASDSSARIKRAEVQAPSIVRREAARAQLPTRFGVFTIVSFEDGNGRPVSDIALVHGEIGKEPTPTRLHSECLTGDTFGSYRCDCGDQLEVSLKRLAGASNGVLLYLRQEGRGIGIGPKVAAYALQDRGLDTVQANRHLGFDDDLRTYDGAGAMLEALGISSILLYTNNPAKLAGLLSCGIRATRVPIVIDARAENQVYLATKRKKMGHLL